MLWRSVPHYGKDGGQHTQKEHEKQHSQVEIVWSKKAKTTWQWWNVQSSHLYHFHRFTHQFSKMQQKLQFMWKMLLTEGYLLSSTDKLCSILWWKAKNTSNSMLGPTDEIIHCGFSQKWTLNWTQSLRIPHSSHLGAEFRFEWATIGHGDRPPADQVVKSPEHSLFYLTHSTPSTPSTSDLQRLRSTSPHGAACLQDPLFWAQQAVESCKLPWQQAQRTSSHCSNMRSCQSEDLRNTKQVSTKLLSLQRKGATTFLLCRLFIKPCTARTACSTWSLNFLLQPPAPSLPRLITLNWA